MTIREIDPRPPMTSDVSCRILECDFSGIEAVLTGYRQRHINAEDARQYIRLARLGIHAAVTARAVGKPADLSWPDDKLGAYLKEIKAAYPFEYDGSKRCLTGDHEVLTPTGWVRLDAYVPGTPVAQWDTDQQLSFVVPSDYIRTGTTKALIKLHGRSLSTIVTHDHRLPYKLHAGAWRAVTAETLPAQGNIPTQGTLDGDETVPTWLLQLIVAAQADAACGSSGLVFHLVKPRKIERLRAILAAGGVDYTDVACACHEGGRRIRVRQAVADQVLAWLDGPDKIFHLPAFFRLTAACREIVLDEMTHWDGYVAKGTTRYAYFTSIYAQAVAVQTIAAVTGRQALLREQAPGADRHGDSNYYVVSFNARRFAAVEALERTTVPYDGRGVYCLTVPSSYFLIRHDDRVSVTGNCVHGNNFGLTTHGMVEKFPDLYPNLAAAQRFQDFYADVAPALRPQQDALRKQAYTVGYLGGPQRPQDPPSQWYHEYGYRHWFWDVLSYQPTDEFTYAKWKKHPQLKDRVVRLHNRPFKVRPGNDWNRVIAFYPQSTAAGRLKEAQLRLFLPWSPDYIGDCYFGRTPLLGPIHDSLLLHIPNRCWDRVVEIVCRVMQEPSPYLPVPTEWGLGPYLPIGVSAKAGVNWAPQLTEEKIAKIQAKAASEGKDVPHLVPNETGMEDIEIPAWVPHAGADDPVLPREESDEDDWKALARVVAA